MRRTRSFLRPRLSTLLLAGAAIAAATGCGASSDLFSSGSESLGAGGAPGQGGASTTATAGGEGGESPFVASSTAAGPSTSTAVTSSVATSTSATATTGPGTGPATTTGSGTGGSPPMGLACGDDQCPLGKEACCWDRYQAYDGDQAECVSGPPDSDECNTSELGGEGIETRIECQVPSHCPPQQRCCGDRHTFYYQGQQYGYYETLRCKDFCDWPDIVMCDPQLGNGQCPKVPVMNGPPVQGVCKPSELLPPGYFVCGQP